MTKICFIINQYNCSGGTERVLSQLANGLARRDYDISIVSLGSGLSPHFYTDPKIHLYELNANHKIGSGICGKIKKIISEPLVGIKKSKKIKDILSEINPNFVVTIGIGFYRYVEYARRKLGVKTIVCEHYCLDAYDVFWINFSRYLAIRHASKVVVLSDGDLKAYQEKYQTATNLHRIYNPISFAFTNNIDVTNKIVVAAGRYSPEKGFDMLIESWSKIAEKVFDWELRIFGEGDDREKLQKQINSLNLSNVKLCGYAEELDKEFEKASFFVLSSRYEGWGLVLTEAQSKGLPCVSFNCKIGPAEIVDDGINGFLVAPNDTDALANKMFELMQNEELRREFSANAQKDLYRFELKNIINEWVSLFESLSRE